MRWVSYLLIVVGMVIIIFPKANELVGDLKQRSLLETVELEMVIASENIGQRNQRLNDEYSRVSEILDNSLSADSEQRWTEPEMELASEAVQAQDISPPQNRASNHNGNKQRAIAVIKISKIDLHLPVLEGATQSNMKYAAAHLKETAGLGQEGNAAIAAHRARTKGRLFNRLNELVIGDEIVIETRGEKFVYTVDKISTVEPTDISVLDTENPDDKVLTLITCDPIVNPTHRLIVRAKL